MVKNIIWDFDGVILDSMPIREYGFRKIFEEYDKHLVEKLLDFHEKNGGLSRYVKIRYFFETLLEEKVTGNKVKKFAEKFSEIMKKELTNKKYLIYESVEYIQRNYKNYHFHIASGSDEKELNYLCRELGIAQYFLSINGSPIHKNNLVKNIIAANEYLREETVLIGDSYNDYEAAKVNDIDFYGYNNEALKEYATGYIESFQEVEDIVDEK